MATTASLGLPITSTFALPLSIYYLFLQVRVTFTRINTKVSLAPSSTTVKPGEDDPLLSAFRTQANFAENVPLALILSGLVEANGGNKTFLTTVLSVLTVGRIMHGEFGLMTKGAGGIGRPIGFFSTMGVIGSLAVYGAWCSRSCWGV